MIVNKNALAGLSLAGNIILGAYVTADYAGRALSYWDNAILLDDKKALRKRGRVEALLEEIKGKYPEYFPVNTPILDAHQAIQEICAAVSLANDYYKSAEEFGRIIGDPSQTVPRRMGVIDCDAMETGILNASIHFACYKIGSAIYTAAMVENVTKFWDGQPLPDAERAEVEAIRAQALAALEPVREKYGLVIPVANGVKEADELTDLYEMDYIYTLKKIWKTSGVEIL